MADSSTSLTKKLQIKPNSTIHLMNAPEGFSGLLTDLPDGSKIVDMGDGPFDCVQLFVHNKADVEIHATQAIKWVKPGGLLWIAYPKKSRSAKTRPNINRDSGWETVQNAGWEGVRQISINATWSSLRFRPLTEIPKLTRKFGPNATQDEA